MQFMVRILGLSIVLIAFNLPCPAYAESNIMFVLDVSGSMSQKIGTQSKMDIAKRAFSGLVDSLEKDTNSGLVVYGHHGDKDCSAIEMAVPLAKNNGTKLKNAIANLSPQKGATPLTNAIYLGAKSLVEDADGERAIVLISDGKENCGDDPVVFVTTFTQSMPSGKTVKFYVIGLDVDAASKTQLEKIATYGGGTYYSAGNEKELISALSRVAAKVVKTPIFEDDFSSTFLNEAWQVLNDDQDMRVLEDGHLNIITGAGGFKEGGLSNIFSFNTPFSEEKYDILVTATVEAEAKDYNRFLTWGHIAFGLRMEQSPDNDVQLSVKLVNVVGSSPSAQGFFGKTKNGKFESARNAFLASPVNGPSTLYLRLEKRGFKYTGYASADNKNWVDLGTQFLIGKNLKPQLFASTGSDFNQVLVSFDDFKILRVEEE